ncbi:MAG TPA: SpoIID/LytB domain-containing protein [Nocardioidaceae bacterium]|nr:SpoIID/LytB domain-containing protein [Nocardioidaceae bacterium]
MRRLLAALVAGSLVLGVGSVVGADAKDVAQAYPVPPDRVFQLRGHGYGHGHGMSQYGARGAAREGLTWKQILAFYYPGTTLATTADEIRVLISADTSQDVVVGFEDGLSIRDRSTGTTYTLPAKAGATRWRLNPSGAKNVAGWYDGSWHAWKTFAGDAEFFAPGKALTLVLPSGTRTYRGALRAAAPTQGSSSRDTVNVLSIDDYLKGVVPAEMPPTWEKAAVRAQAVAARTYAAWSRAVRINGSWQICDTTSCQVYGGVRSEHADANAAIEYTAGQILTYGDKPAFTQFSSSSGGWTSAGSAPYLVSQADPYEASSGNPYTNWSVAISAAAIEKAYPIGSLLQVLVTSREGGGDWQGRVQAITLDGDEGDVVVSGDSFRSRFGLRSTYFTFGDSAIIVRWRKIGAEASVVGALTGTERTIPGGAAQDFAKGAIYWSTNFGAREMYGPILGLYRSLKESAHPLGVPRSVVQKRRPDGARVLFADGVAFTKPGVGTAALTGAIADRYLAEGGIRSALGWPVRGNFTTTKGERARFQKGYIAWNRATGATKVVIRQ